MTIRLFVLATGFVAAAATAQAQEPVLSAPRTDYGGRPGWTFIPSFGVEETYDDNISMFGVRTAEDVNNDFLTRYAPSADVHYSGKHTSFDSGYSGSFLAYRTYAQLNQWDQRGHVSIKRQESTRFEWLASAMAATVPTTDLINLAGIPYRRVGSSIADANASFSFRLDARNTLTGSTILQRIVFDEPQVPGTALLQGGRAFNAFGGWRNHVSERLGLGVDYGLRRSVAIDNTVPFIIHSFQGAADYAASPTWDISASGGVVFLRQNELTPGSTGPAWRLAADHHRPNLTLSAWYLQTYLPSFGLGGTVRSHEVGTGLHAPLFNNRHLYADESLHFRDDTPLTFVFNQLPLTSLRIRSVIGWAPNPWVRVEGFYMRVQQTSERVGGQMYRNIVGVQIVTSRPMRID
jgi:hypothetical protein